MNPAKEFEAVSILDQVSICAMVKTPAIVMVRTGHLTV